MCMLIAIYRIVFRRRPVFRDCLFAGVVMDWGEMVSNWEVDLFAEITISVELNLKLMLGMSTVMQYRAMPWKLESSVYL